MKYFFGQLVITDHESRREYSSLVCVVAKSEPQALKLLKAQAADWGGDDVVATDEGGYLYNSHDEEGYTVETGFLREITPSTFADLRKTMSVLGDVSADDLSSQSVSEQNRTLALNLGQQLNKLGIEVPHGKLLTALASSLGETDWQVLKHKAIASPAKSQALDEAKTSENRVIVPGTGSLWAVPVSVDTSMTAQVLVRADNRDDAMALARKAAYEGHARFEVDEGNYRGLADYYVPDESEDSVRLVEEVESPGFGQARVGAYLVELTDLGDGDDSLLWADLTVFDSDEPEGETVSCMSSCPASATPEEQTRFCARVAQLLHDGAPVPQTVSVQALGHVFTQAVQGDSSDKAYAVLLEKLKQMQL